MTLDYLGDASFLAAASAKGGANSFALAILAFKKGGWIVSLIGAAAMVGRLLIDEAETASVARSVKHVIAAAIFAIIAFFVTFQWEIAAINKAIIQGLTGALAPELIDWMTFNIKQKLGMNKKPARKRSRRKRSSGLKRSQPAKKPGSAAKPRRRGR